MTKKTKTLIKIKSKTKILVITTVLALVALGAAGYAAGFIPMSMFGRKTTFIIASHNTPSFSLQKYNKDFYCDGVDDNVEIQQAIDNLPPKGGTILLLAGDYNISETVDLNKDNITIRGKGFDTKLRAVDGLNARLFMNITLSNIKNTVFKSLEIDGNRLNQDAVSENNVAITLRNATASLIEKVYIHDTSDEAVGFGGTSGADNVVRNSHFQNATAEHGGGVETTSGHITQAEGRNLTIKNNVFEYATDNAIMVGWVDGVLIENNTFRNVFITALGGDSSNIRVVGNDISGAAPISDTVGLKVMMGARGIGTDHDIIIEDNYIHDITEDKRSVWNFTSDSDVENVIIRNNIYENLGHLANIVEANRVENLTIEGEKVYRTRINGIVIRGCSHVRVLDNKIQNTNISNNRFATAIHVGGFGSTISSDIEIEGNRIYNKGGVPLMARGINIPAASQAEGVSVRHNRVSGARESYNIDPHIIGLVMEGNE